MVTMDNRPNVGGNTDQPDDGRDKDGHLPEPLDSAHFPPTEDGPAIVLPGMALSQPVGTGPVVSSEQAKADKTADKTKTSGGMTTENSGALVGAADPVAKKSAAK
jgi:hypothetical protein